MIIDSSILKKLYSVVLSNTDDKLTTSELMGCGFNYKGINKLVEDGVIARNKRGIYSFKAINDLLNYGRSLLGKDLFKEAKHCFDRCYELDPNNYDVCFQLFYNSVLRKNYEDSFRYLDGMIENGDKYDEIDCDYYLFLLNFITEIPEKYQEYVKYLTFEYLMIPADNPRYENIYDLNTVRGATVGRNFNYAYGLILGMLNISQYRTMSNKLVMNLLFEAKKTNSAYKASILSLVEEKKYEEALSEINKRGKKCGFSIFEHCCCDVLNDILAIEKTGLIPEKSEMSKETISEAIKTRNYDVALNIFENGIIRDQEVYLLVRHICELIKEYQSGETAKKVAINCLQDNDIEGFNRILHGYLESIDGVDYEFLFKDLNKLAQLKKCDFTDTINLLNNFDSEYKIEIEDYIPKFYDCLVDNNFQLAEIYLDIIKGASKLNNDFTIGDKLHSVLETVRNSVMMRAQTEVIAEADNSNIKALKETRVGKYVLKKYQELVNKSGVVLFDPINDEDKGTAYRILESFDNMHCFEIEEGKEKRIVLKKHESHEDCDFSEVLREGKSAFYSKDYQKSLACFLSAINHFYYPKESWLYKFVGVLYFKLGDIDSAKDYFAVSQWFATEQNTAFSTDEILDKLSNKKSSGTTNSEEEIIQYQNIDDIYDKVNFDEVNELVKLTGLDVDTACCRLGFDHTKTDTIMLLYARTFFKQSMPKKAEEFLKVFRESDAKTEFNEELYTEIVTNKNLYAIQGVKNNYGRKVLTRTRPQVGILL